MQEEQRENAINKCKSNFITAQHPQVATVWCVLVQVSDKLRCQGWAVLQQCFDLVGDFVLQTWISKKIGQREELSEKQLKLTWRR